MTCDESLYQELIEPCYLYIDKTFNKNNKNSKKENFILSNFNEFESINNHIEKENNNLLLIKYHSIKNELVPALVNITKANLEDLNQNVKDFLHSKSYPEYTNHLSYICTHLDNLHPYISFYKYEYIVYALCLFKYSECAKLFFARPFWTKLQNIFGHCCMSKLDKVAKCWLAFNRPAEQAMQTL